jgi:FKBP-type peptidyl-prolyl cis-trans isomerase
MTTLTNISANTPKTFFIVLFSFCLLSFAASCTPQPVALDETGELVIENLVTGTGESMPTDTTILQASIRAVGTVRGSATPFRQTVGAPEDVAFNISKMPTGLQSLDSALRGMRVGGKRRITVPPRFAFGTTELAGVPVNSTVVYDVELVGIQRLLAEDTRVGTGDTAFVGKTLSMYYTGKLVNGQVFDRSPSASNPTPFQFQLGAGKVITGWDVGIRGMRVGGRRTLTIPPAFGYGVAGSSRNGVVTIPPNSTLIFDVELEAVN